MVGGRHISRYMYSCIDSVHARSLASRDAKRQRQQLGSTRLQSSTNGRPTYSGRVEAARKLAGADEGSYAATVSADL